MNRFALVLPVLVTAGCVSERLAMPSPPVGPHEQVVAQVEGTAGGFMLFGLVPIGQNDRFQRAYAEAAAKAPLGSRLANVQCWERWYWAYIGNGYVFHVSADCVGPRSGGR